MLLLSAAALAFEINLTRIFSVAQFYHFAFMTVSLALLGFGASGTLLALAPNLVRRPTRALVVLSWGFSLTAVSSYGLTLLLPFDSFRVVLDPGQWGVLALHYLALSIPFLCAGAVAGLLLAARPGQVGRTYAANLVGSALGCLLPMVTSQWVGAEGVVLLTAALGGVAGLVFGFQAPNSPPLSPSVRWAHPRGSRSLARGVQILLVVALLLAAVRVPGFLQIRLSPYKGLSYALQYPDARLTLQEWNGFSRVDIVEATAIRSLPGQGFACPGQPPPQRGLFVDGGGPSPITHISDPADLCPLTDCLLTSLPYRLQPGAHSLVIDSRGGFDLLVALAEGAQAVTVVESNPLAVHAVRAQGAWAGDVYDHPQVELFEEEGRAFLSRPGPGYDVILLALPDTYHPVTSGAYSLAENYGYTVEGVSAALERLDDGGILAMVRWLQVPPSESLRAFGLAVEAVERSGGDPAQSLVALRSYNQMLILTRRGPFSPQELEQVRSFASHRFFDLVYLPDIRPDEANQRNVLPAPDYYLAFTGLLEAEDRTAWTDDYAFDVRPPTDDWPFFGHFFRWRQLKDVLAMAGHIWQPFGGAGYLVLFALLAVASAAAVLLILLPLAGPCSSRPSLRGGRAFVRLLPFGFLGLAYLFVEIPLLQRFILFLGHPSYAMATILGTVLLFSGIGSVLSARVRLDLAMGVLVGGVLLYRVGLPLVSGSLLGLPLAVRLAVTVVGLAPLGILMGVPFPHILAGIQEEIGGLVPWAWGINGALSVVASVLAAVLALSWGFGVVMVLGALCYLGAWITTAWATRGPHRADSLPSPGR